MLYFPGDSYKMRSYYEAIIVHTGSAGFQHFTSENEKEVYNFSKFIIKQIIYAEEWGISTMHEKQVYVNKIIINFTYWDYIHAFSKIFYYNNDKHKHTWFIMVCAKSLTKLSQTGGNIMDLQ